MDHAGSLQWLAFEIELTESLCLMIQYRWTNHVDVNTLYITVFIWLNTVTFTLVRKINVVTIQT